MITIPYLTDASHTSARNYIIIKVLYSTRISGHIYIEHAKLAAVHITGPISSGN